MRELLQLPQLLWLPWVVMSRAPDWREQQNSHFLPCWGPASCGCQPGGGVKLLWLLRQPQPGPCLGPYCAPGAWCPALPQLSGVLGSHPVFLQLCKQHSLLQRFPGPPHLLGRAFSFLLSRPEAILQHVGTLVLPESFLPMLSRRPAFPWPLPLDQAASLVSLFPVCALKTTIITLTSPPSPPTDNRLHLLPHPTPTKVKQTADNPSGSTINQHQTK